MSTNTRYLPFVGRLLTGFCFFMSGLNKLGAYAGTTAAIASVGLPVPPAAYLVAVLCEVGGGLLLMLGFRTRAAAAIIAVFVLTTAIFFHSNFADQNQMIHFFKNLMIIGGLLHIVYFGSGTFSLDNRIAARR